MRPAEVGLASPDLSPRKTKGQEALEMIQKLSRTSVVCVICAEADWRRCHRQVRLQRRFRFARKENPALPQVGNFKRRIARNGTGLVGAALQAPSILIHHRIRRRRGRRVSMNSPNIGAS